ARAPDRSVVGKLATRCRYLHARARNQHRKPGSARRIRSEAAAMTMAREAILSIRGLRVEFPTQIGLVTAVDGLDLDVAAGECLGVVGESGSGKSATFASVLGLVRPPGRIAGGSVRYFGRELVGLAPAAMRAIRGKEIAITLQD